MSLDMRPCAFCLCLGIGFIWRGGSVTDGAAVGVGFGRGGDTDDGSTLRCWDWLGVLLLVIVCVAA